MKSSTITLYFYRNKTITKLEKGWEVEGSFDIYKTLQDAKNYINKTVGYYSYSPEHEKKIDIKIIGTIDYSNYDKTRKAEYNYTQNVIILRM